MNKMLPWAIALAFLGPAPAALAGAGASAAPGAEIAGHWLSVDYMNAFAKSRSPLAASNAASLVALLVEPSTEHQGYTFSVTSFHEGLNYLIKGFDSKDGKITIEADSFDDGDESLQTLKLESSEAPDGTRLLTGTLWGEEKVTYRRLPDTVAVYVNGLTVAGTYVDAKGETYVFEANGSSTWAGKNRNYEVVVDTYEASCDQICHYDPAKPEDTTFSGYKLQGNKLELYELTEAEETMFKCADKPFLVLSPKN
jgi:hypothetical protein